MKRSTSIVAILGLMCTSAAWAQAPENPFSNESGSGSTAPPASSNSNTNTSQTLPTPDAKPDILLRMSKKDCEKILRRADVAGADYVAGVDVRGNSVAGADLQGTLTASDILPEEIAFELNMNPLTFAGNSDLADTFSESSSGFGMVRYNLSSGVLTLDGKRLTGETEDDLIGLCRQALGR